MTEYNSYTLNNGLRIVHLPKNTNVSYCGFIVNAGSRDETPEEYGMAHFVEHMLFKGTKKRRSHHIIRRMENVGGEINAYTNKEETVLYSVFLNEHFERALELTSDLLFNSTYPEREIEKEREVILDEIASYEDNPVELIFDEFENIVFRDTQFGHNILGYPETLEKFDTKQISQFISTHYHLNNIVFFSVGKTNFKKITKLAEKYLGYLSDSNNIYRREVPKIAIPNKTRIQKDTTQSHIIIGTTSYNLHNPKRKILYLLNNIIGGPGMNSRLNISLREKMGYVYNVESNVTSYSDTGLFSIYLGCDKKNIENCLHIIRKELKKFKEKRLTERQLMMAKKQYIGQIAISNDNHENLAISLGKSYLYYNKFNDLGNIFNEIESIQSSDIMDVANEIFNENNFSQLIFQ